MPPLYRFILGIFPPHRNRKPPAFAQRFLREARVQVSMRVVWLKHDLRLSDHAPSQKPLQARKTFCCCTWWNLNAWSNRTNPCSILRGTLPTHVPPLEEVSTMGGTMQIHVGRPSEILDQLHMRTPLTSLHSHEETGLQWSWDRDQRVAAWCNANSIQWHEHSWNGVVRRLNDRDRWNSIRNRRMVQPLIEAPTVLPGHPTIRCTDHSKGLFPCYSELVRTPLEAGEKAAHAWLTSFLGTRFCDYLPTISNPATSPEGSSRLSAYLTSGVLSVRQVKHAITAARQSPPEGMDVAVFRKNIDAFASRVSWRCHFVQRLEMETSMNERSINPELDEALGRIDDEERFLAWAEGRTGWPFFDACMRSLRATGWINFRMRAMMQSVAAYTLWIPWQRSGNHLAKLFIDYEPGIHWSQIHMQSGITGINSVRAPTRSSSSRSTTT